MSWANTLTAVLPDVDRWDNPSSEQPICKVSTSWLFTVKSFILGENPHSSSSLGIRGHDSSSSGVEVCSLLNNPHLESGQRGGLKVRNPQPEKKTICLMHRCNCAERAPPAT
ncbi:hypothetical protein EVAR_2255_1 [Eumeta japonica]|uniref:Uncharacterized protein n=1 Tax=Eumeta variegata TaxID=151549 RepID=A0A4C1SHT7_EUMVA|nr:hypothetical protein EVAR_2255_1 [Eumeta japonica]